MNRRGTIAYIGSFELPDGNAAAHRVVANAKIFRCLGFDTIFLQTQESKSQEVSQPRETEGFKIYSLDPGRSKTRDLYRAIGPKTTGFVLDKHPDLRAVIAYNYPSIALLRLQRYCRQRKVKFLVDATEWYAPRPSSLISVIRTLDSTIRMRLLHKRADGAIVISRLLANYYRRSTTVLQLPPLVDSADPKWPKRSHRRPGPIRFVYAGSPSARKERLDEIVATFEELGKNFELQLDIYGLTVTEYGNLYHTRLPSGTSHWIRFHGRVNHTAALSAVASADYTLIIREDSLLVRAGFPTKFVESVSAGTPVIATSHPDLSHYLQDEKYGLLATIRELPAILQGVAKRAPFQALDRSAFDYRLYVEATSKFFEQVGVGYVEK